MSLIVCWAWLFPDSLLNYILDGIIYNLFVWIFFNKRYHIITKDGFHMIHQESSIFNPNYTLVWIFKENIFIKKNNISYRLVPISPLKNQWKECLFNFLFFWVFSSQKKETRFYIFVKMIFNKIIHFLFGIFIHTLLNEGWLNNDKK